MTEPTLRAVAASAFLPALVYEIGNGACAPVIALTALQLGARSSTAGFMLALLGIGQIVGDLPAATLADRIGDRRAMRVAAAVAGLAWLACVLAPSLLVLGCSLLVIGMSTSTFYLARQSYLSEVVAEGLRARAMSTLGGAHRIGLFIGPFVGAGAIRFGGMRAAYLVAVITTAVVAVLLTVISDVETPADRLRGIRRGVSSVTMVSTHWRLFATLGTAILAIGAVRAARQTVLPLWAAHIGLNPETTSIVFGIASAVDMALFYPAGKIMDHYGRLAIAIPATTLMGISMLLIPLTQGVIALTAVAMLMSLGNGIGSGLVMTLGVDAAPVHSRTRFLSIWRMIGDTGQAAGPLAIASVAVVWTLAAGIATIGVTSLLAAPVLAASVPRYSPFGTRAMARARRAQAPGRP